MSRMNEAARNDGALAPSIGLIADLKMGSAMYQTQPGQPSVTIEDQGSLHQSYMRMKSPPRVERKAMLHTLNQSMRDETDAGLLRQSRKRSPPQKLMDPHSVQGLLLQNSAMNEALYNGISLDALRTTDTRATTMP